MPSYLGEYSGNYGRCATDRARKFERAVESVLAQTAEDWELLVVADGCDETWAYREKYTDERIRFLRIPKQPLWSTAVRNAGILKSSGQYIAYLDTDDVWAQNHLSGLRTNVVEAGSPGWAWFDDWVWSGDKWARRKASATSPLGTSNIVHVGGTYWPPAVYRWPAMGYDHDAAFVKYLRHTMHGVRIEAGEYRVCHIPNRYEL